MKKSSWKSLTFVRVLSMGIILSALRQNVLTRKKSAPRILLAAILPLSSCSRSTRMIFKGIMCYALVFACVSCKSVDLSDTYHSTLNSQHSTLKDTLMLRDSVVLHDSVVYRERTVHDTVYVTKEVYRDRLEARGERRKAERKDTVVVTEYRDRVIEHPPEKYVPKFYKWCTIILFIILAAGIVYLIIRLRLRL